MTSANTLAGSSTHAPSVLLLGTDAVLAARPSTAVQLAHACMHVGYSLIVPPSWGDELLATETVRWLRARERQPVAYCACPRVVERLLDVGDDLVSLMLPLVSPPVATARYLREIAGATPLHITFVGACPGAIDPSIDERISPAEMFTRIEQRGIRLAQQPQVYEAVLPPDRRRHRSLPGGIPAPEELNRHASGWSLVEICAADALTEFAQQVATGGGTLLDLSPILECACSGAVRGLEARRARSAVTALEPPRSTSDIIDPSVLVQLERALDAPGEKPASDAPSESQPLTAPVGAAARVAERPQDAPDSAVTTAGRETPAGGRRRARVVDERASGAKAAGTAARTRTLPRAYVALRAKARRMRAMPTTSGDEAPLPIRGTYERDTRPSTSDRRLRAPAEDNGGEDRGGSISSRPSAVPRPTSPEAERAGAEQRADQPSPTRRIFASVPIATPTRARREEARAHAGTSEPADAAPLEGRAGPASGEPLAMESGSTEPQHAQGAEPSKSVAQELSQMPISTSASPSTPPSAPASAPPSAPASAPRSAPASAPRSAPASAPRSAPASAPPSAPNVAAEMRRVLRDVAGLVTGAFDAAAEALFDAPSSAAGKVGPRAPRRDESPTSREGGGGESGSPRSAG